MSNDPRVTERRTFLSLVTLVQGGLLLIALTCGAFMRTPPWKECTLSWQAVGIGIAATIPMLAFFAGTYRNNSPGFRKIKNLIDGALGKPLAACNGTQVFAVAFMAGVSEEFLFRGVIEPCLSGYSPLLGLALCNLLFGACHAATRLYAVLATLLGCYLSLTLRLTPEPNLVVPIVAHAFYDLVAFIVVRNSYRKSHPCIAQSDNAPAIDPNLDVPSTSVDLQSNGGNSLPN